MAFVPHLDWSSPLHSDALAAVDIHSPANTPDRIALAFEICMIKPLPFAACHHQHGYRGVTRGGAKPLSAINRNNEVATQAIRNR